jgi:hypothetical protein
MEPVAEFGKLRSRDARNREVSERRLDGLGRSIGVAYDAAERRATVVWIKTSTIKQVSEPVACGRSSSTQRRILPFPLRFINRTAQLHQVLEDRSRTYSHR